MSTLILCANRNGSVVNMPISIESVDMIKIQGQRPGGWRDAHRRTVMAKKEDEKDRGRRFSMSYYRPAGLLSQGQIAKRIGSTQSSLSHIFTGRRKVSIDMAEKLERATGVPREAWAWPMRHYNPYIPLMPKGACKCDCANVTPKEG